jgi:hypothetical protein
VSTQPTSDIALEPHYTVAQIAADWAMDYKTVRRLFENQPGVLAIGTEGTIRKRKYISLRIPESVRIRVHRDHLTR